MTMYSSPWQRAKAHYYQSSSQTWLVYDGYSKYICTCDEEKWAQFIVNAINGDLQ